MKKQDTIRKIKALLALTTQNGAGEQEALSALAKAQELMRNYHVSQSDLVDKSETFIFKGSRKPKSVYLFTGFERSLSELFCCKSGFKRKKNGKSGDIKFFGEIHNVEICNYFYKFIIRACKYEMEIFKTSRHYIFYKKHRHIHGKTLIKSFIFGFMEGMDTKLKQMIKDRNSDATYGLIVSDKFDLVKKEFANRTKTFRRKRRGNYRA